MGTESSSEVLTLWMQGRLGRCVANLVLHSIISSKVVVVSRDGRGTVCNGFVTRVGISEGK